MTDQNNSDQRVTDTELNSDGFPDRMNFLKDQHGSAAAIARLAGLSESVIRKWLKGMSDPSRANLVALARGTGTRIEWLATGEEPIYQPNEIKEETPTFTKHGDQFSLIPLYDVIASAGPGAAIDQEHQISELAFRQDWLSQEGLTASNLSAITADGDSMEPTILDGSMLLIDTSQRTLAGERIYVLRMYCVCTAVARSPLCKAPATPP